MDRREREQSRYKRGMASKTAAEANRRAGELFSSSALNLPKGAKALQIKSDKALRLDILPYEVGKGNPFADEGHFHYERTFWVHNGVGPDNRRYSCPNKNSGGKLPCPICEHVKKLQDDEDMDTKEKDKLLGSLRAKRRQLFNVIDVNEPEKGVQIWDYSYALFGEKLLDMLEDEEFAKERGSFCEFEGGKTLRIKFKKEKMGRAEYYDVTDIAFLDRKEDYKPDKMLKLVHCLDKCVKVLPYDELKQTFLQTGEKTDTNPKFRRSDLKRIEDMTDKELNKFIAMNDIDLDTDDYETTEDLQEAVIAEVKKALEAEAVEEDESKSKKSKKDTGKGKKKSKKDEEEESEEEEEESEEDESEDEDESEEESEEEETAEAEVGSNVTWTDDDGDDHEGEVIKIKKGTATVKEGKKKYEVDVSDLTLA